MESSSLITPVGQANRALGASHKWKVLGVGVVANASFSATATGIPTTAIWMRHDYHLGNAELGLVMGSMGLGLALSELPWGFATDRFGDRPVLMTGLVSTALMLLVTALFAVPSAGSIPPLQLLVALMCVVGLLGGSVNGSSGRAVMSWFKDGERGLAMSIRQTAVPLGGGIGALLLPWLAQSRGFGGVFGALAVMVALSAGFAWRWLHEPPVVAAHAAHAAKPADGAAPRGPLTDIQIWRVVLGIGILCVPQFAVLTFATVFLHDFARLHAAGISATMAVIQGGAMAMRVWSGRYTDKRGNRRSYLRGSTLVAAGSFAVLALAVAVLHNAFAAVLVVLIVVAGICVSAWHGVAYTELATLAGPQRAGTALGMTNTVVYGGLFVAPIAIPHLLAASSWTGVWIAAGLSALLTYPLFPKAVRAIAR
ncbi:MFS transporter [Trinickia sp. YCB016]